MSRRALVAGALVVAGAGCLFLLRAFWSESPQRPAESAPARRRAMFASSTRRLPPPRVAASPGADAAAAETTRPTEAVARRARWLVDRLAQLLVPGRARTDEEQKELEAIEAEILALGEGAVPALAQRLDRGGDAAGVRDLLFNILRRLPGPSVEERLAVEARAGVQPSMRTMAIESLAERRTDRTLAALAGIARTDPDLPARPLITGPRDPAEPSTELPDEEVFTPRMQAMAALASTKDPRAVEVLTDVLRTGPDESLRMEAARNLEGLRGDPRAGEALRLAAASDVSPYVRLAALHALNGSKDPSLAPVLEGIAARDRDAGVRALAEQVLASLRQ